ncbi:MAG: efflux RND transporter periplasmic adaptor subunit [Clostridia bacterium]
MRKLFFTLFSTFIIIMVILLVHYWDMRAVIDVNVYQLKETGIVSSISSSGKIEEVHKVDLYVNIPLKVQELRVKEGDKVEEGEPLVKLEIQGLKLELEQARANLEIEKLNFASTMRKNYSTFEFKEEGIPSLEGNETAAAVFSSEDAITVYQKKVEIAELKVQELEKKLKQQPETLISPITGVITAVNIKQGTLTNAAQPVIIISDIDSLQIKVDVEEYYISKIREGQEVEITAEAFEEKNYSGIVKKISPVAKQIPSGQSTSTVVEIIIDILDEDSLLKPGFSARVKVLTDNKEKTLILPYEAIIQDEGNNDIVYIVSNNRAYKRKITTGIELELEIEVLTGLKEHDRVILNPAPNMKDGMKVRMTNKKKVIK